MHWRAGSYLIVSRVVVLARKFIDLTGIVADNKHIVIAEYVTRQINVES